MIQQSDLDKIDRFISGQSDVTEERSVYALFSENEENRELMKYMQSRWEQHVKESSPDNPEIMRILDRIQHIHAIRENQKGNKTIYRLYRWYSVAAAILLIPLLVAGMIWFSVSDHTPVENSDKGTFTRLYAPLGSRINFDLPDGSQVWLNSGSSLEYSLPFANQRNVHLEGEAWFDVVRDADHPFQVSVADSKIKVLGTKFNVSGYDAEKYVEVVLDEGKVEFECPEISSGVIMKPDERLVYQNGQINRNETDATKYAAWVEGKLIFRGDPMSEVARRIERWYNVEVEVVDKDLEQYVFRGTFEDDSLEELLRLLSMTSPIKYRIIERKMQDDGTFGKTKVLLSHK